MILQHKSIITNYTTRSKLMNKIRVIHSISSLDLTIGGPARSLPTMCAGTQKQGIMNEILTYESPNPNIDKIEKENISISFIEIEKSFLGRHLSLNYRNAVKKIDCDIIHIHSLWLLSIHWAALWGKQNDIPMIVSPRGTLEKFSMSNKWFKKKLAMWLYQRKDLIRAACFHATSQSEVDNFRKRGLKSPIALIPNGIDVNNYPLHNERIKREHRTILFLSRIHPQKGIQILLEAWHEIDEAQRKGWQVIIAGEGEKDYTTELQNLIREKYFGSDIFFVGPQYGKDKIRMYHQADIFILPSFSENFGMVIAEAMSCGVPVITTTGTPWELLKKECAGWWVDNTVESIRDAIKSAIKLTDLERIAMGKKARKIIERDFSIEEIANKYTELYKWVLNSSNPAPNFILKCN